MTSMGYISNAMVLNFANCWIKQEAYILYSSRSGIARGLSIHRMISVCHVENL